jgi:uncharacterized membrane protein
MPENQGAEQQQARRHSKLEAEMIEEREEPAGAAHEAQSRANGDDGQGEGKKRSCRAHAHIFSSRAQR